MRNWRPTFSKIVEKELMRFMKKRDYSINEFCIRVNAWRIKHKLPPVEGTPFQHPKDKKIYIEQEKKVKCLTEINLMLNAKGEVKKDE
jgi:hypothetical protein